ncbi:helix-turn-helix transcriptional regulator [Halobacterium bonnevillei]|uniref:Winged helix-turn-helix transcriptional regulator n=1 Tax=Halobacterium bonnevillei TaxID=2692200 RepID=A0A6B0SEZ7_9EURY|nr:winged helix-turn-helix transcriptional regulator [Halobacterium bonnevillei]MXR19577.1 winged helix-turn-helix transcriptional regulator [Halobacterium bonnevillei]
MASTSGVASAGAADLSYASNDSTAATNATVENVTFSESAANTTNEGHPVIWQGQSFETTVEYDPPDKSGYEVCLWADTSEVQSCKTVNLGDPANRTSVTFELSEWPTDENGKVALSTELRFDGETLDSSTTDVVVLAQNGSYDGDSLQNTEELGMNSSVLSADTDNDGLRDGREIELATDPTDPDSDDDGLRDARELELGTDPTEKDTDGDGLTDGREAELGTDPTEKDTDGDGLSDDTEVTYGTNPTSSKSPFTVAVGVVVTGVAGIIFATRRFDGGLFQWRANDRSILSFPARSGHSESPSQEQQDADEEPATETQQAETPGVAANRAIDPDRERVLRILQESGGRIRQRQVVDETDWSASKVSRRLSKMEDDGLISKVTIGRENIVMLDDEDHGADFDET